MASDLGLLHHGHRCVWHLLFAADDELSAGCVVERQEVGHFACIQIPLPGKMGTSSDVLYALEEKLMDYYSRGPLASHAMWSWPDSEAVLSAYNHIMEGDTLRDFLQLFDNYRYDGYQITDAKVVYPHQNHLSHEIPPPSPDMTDEELDRYIWPTAALNRDNQSYTGFLWIQLSMTEITFEQGVGNVRTSRQRIISKWESVLELPIQVGSIRCNMAIMRSYLSDPKWSTRARAYLERIKWEYLLPDGYFIISGKFKKVNISDRLMMNMQYIVKMEKPVKLKDTSVAAIKHITCEVRSVRQDIGLSFMKVFLALPGKVKPLSSMDNQTFKFYNTVIVMTIDEMLPYPLNIFDMVRAYGVIVLDNDANNMDDPMHTLMQYIREYSYGDQEAMRMAEITMHAAMSATIDSIFAGYASIFLDVGNRSIEAIDEARDELSTIMREKIFPHCEIDDDPQGSFNAKIRFLAMMVVDLVLATTGDSKKGLKVRLEPTNRKDFIYKRWETVGHAIKDHIRGMFIPHVRIKNIDGVSIRTRETTPINTMMRHKGELISFMHRNQWPIRYKAKDVRHIQSGDYASGYVDDIHPTNIVAILNAIRTVKISTSGPNTADTRMVYPSQWALQCPVNTPENDNIGLNNNLAEACLISNDLLAHEKEALAMVLSDMRVEEDTEGSCMLILDGCPLQFVMPEQAVDTLRQKRSTGDISRGIGIAFRTLWAQELPPGIPVVVVRTSHGRPIVPLISLKEGRFHVQDMLENMGTRTIEDLMDDGIIEFVDAYEMVFNTIIADRGVYDATDVHTHAMIKPGHILSQATNCLSFLEHNTAARGIYATKHMEQAIGRPFIHPEDRFDHDINYLNNPELPLISSSTLRRITSPNVPGGVNVSERNVGFGRNMRIACMSLIGNNDDGIHMSESLAKSGMFDGEHVRITTSDWSTIPSSTTYEWLISDETNREIIHKETGQGIPDPNFSSSVITPYGRPYIIEVPEDTLKDRPLVDKQSYGSPIADEPCNLYELYPGELYARYGYRSSIITMYSNTDTGETKEIVTIPGKAPIAIPGMTAIQTYIGPRIYQMALMYAYQETEVTTNNRPNIVEFYDSSITLDPIDTRFTVYEDGWHHMGPTSIPAVRILNTPGTVTRQGIPVGIRPRRHVKRGDTAIKIMKRVIDVPLSEAVSHKGEREKFEITFGYLDGIHPGTITKIRSNMPIGVKPGNKYTIFHAQKSVVAKILPDDEMPIAKWSNQVLHKDEEMHIDIAFNPLSFPSRMTMGMEYEVLFSGTIRYIYELKHEDGRSYRKVYEDDKEEFDDIMSSVYGIDGASAIMELLMDTTCFIHDNLERLKICEDLREKIGIPSSGLCRVEIGGEPVANNILCGNVFQAALPHLVDNKRRARGYVGSKDFLTHQPVKGRRRDGGANTGIMETDAYKAHGARKLLWERLSRVSDFITLRKCPRCGGLVTHDVLIDKYICMDCQLEMTESETIKHDTVVSWHLMRMYARAAGMDILESFKDTEKK